MKTERFYGYKHWTLEALSRCFNVGKGRRGRAESSTRRNHKWHAMVKRLGLRVEVCVGFKCNNHVHDYANGEKCPANQDACAWEIENIALMGTFSTNHSHDDPVDIGCNFTRGGEGATGRKWDMKESARRSAASVKRWASPDERTRHSETLKLAAQKPDARERRQQAGIVSWRSHERRQSSSTRMKALWAQRRFRRSSHEWFTRKLIDLTQLSKRSQTAHRVQNQSTTRAKNSAAQKAVWYRRKCKAFRERSHFWFANQRKTV